MQKRVTTVAVVDDDPSMLKAAADLMEARGFSTSLFTSAEEFLDSGSQPGLPVIFMTALDDEAIRQQALRVGCVACLRKPFPARELIDAIERAVPH